MDKNSSHFNIFGDLHNAEGQTFYELKKVQRIYRNKSAVRLDEEIPAKVTNFNPNLYKSSTAHRIFQKHDDDSLSTTSKQNG